MFKAQIISGLIAGLLFSISPATSKAGDTIVLGEYTGDGKLNVTVTDENKNNSGYENNCHLALNIDQSASSLDIPFGVITCDAGMDSWNESPIHLDVVGTKLFRNQQEVGSIAANGTATFEVKEVTVVNISVSHTDRNCHPLRFEKTTLKLNSSLKYMIKPIDSKSYMISRLEEADTLQTVYKKEWPDCPAGTMYEVQHSIRTISANISK